MSRSIAALLGISLVLILSASTPNASARTSLVELDNKLNALLDAQRTNPADIIVLTLSTIATSPCSQSKGYRKIQIDGSVDPLEYVVPAGRVLLITEVHWAADDGPSDFVVGRDLYFSLFSVGTPLVAGVYTAPPVTITTANENSLIGGSETLTTGVPFGPGRGICASAISRSQFGSSVNRTSSSILRGVLVDQR